MARDTLVDAGLRLSLGRARVVAAALARESEASWRRNTHTGYRTGRIRSQLAAFTSPSGTRRGTVHFTNARSPASFGVAAESGDAQRVVEHMPRPVADRAVGRQTATHGAATVRIVCAEPAAIPLSQATAELRVVAGEAVGVLAAFEGEHALFGVGRQAGGSVLGIRASALTSPTGRTIPLDHADARLFVEYIPARIALGTGASRLARPARGIPRDEASADHALAIVVDECTALVLVAVSVRRTRVGPKIDTELERLSACSLQLTDASLGTAEAPITRAEAPHLIAPRQASVRKAVGFERPTVCVGAALHRAVPRAEPEELSRVDARLTVGTVLV
jgi:hypothetical protein